MSFAQLEAHAFPLHGYGLHILVGDEHEPPAHTLSVSVPDAHIDAPHEVPSVALHVPSPAHFACLHIGTLAVHAACGSCPAGTFWQWPPALTLHALHPLHVASAVSQQTASTQLPDAHVSAWVHPVPSGVFAVHTMDAL